MARRGFDLNPEQQSKNPTDDFTNGPRSPLPRDDVRSQFIYQFILGLAAAYFAFKVKNPQISKLTDKKVKR